MGQEWHRLAFYHPTGVTRPVIIIIIIIIIIKFFNTPGSKDPGV